MSGKDDGMVMPPLAIQARQQELSETYGWREMVLVWNQQHAAGTDWELRLRLTEKGLRHRAHLQAQRLAADAAATAQLQQEGAALLAEYATDDGDVRQAFRSFMRELRAGRGGQEQR